MSYDATKLSLRIYLYTNPDTKESSSVLITDKEMWDQVLKQLASVTKTSQPVCNSVIYPESAHMPWKLATAQLSRIGLENTRTHYHQ